ncbi:MAG: ribosome assembly cofactor RimP [Bacteroidota bacterium]
MNIVQQLTNWTNEFLPPHLFLVEVEQMQGSKKIAVYIDGDNGVRIEDCRVLSKSLNAKLDEMEFEAEPFYFEVSSPGVDKPLIMMRQYPKHIGRELMIKLKSNTELFGKLTAVNSNSITIMFKDKKKGYLPNATQKEIAIDEIAESIVQISFKK